MLQGNAEAVKDAYQAAIALADKDWFALDACLGQLRLLSLLGLSLPAFVAAIILLMVFAIQFRWFPVISAGGADTLTERLRQMALPTLARARIMICILYTSRCV